MNLRRRTLVAGCALAAAIVAGVLGGTTAASTGATGGTVVFGAEQEPPCLNGVLAGCNNTWTSWTVGISFPGLYKILPNGDLVPDMIEAEAKTTSRPFTVTYKLKKNANWSDGKPVTAQDVIFTLTTIMNPKNDVAGRAGYEDIARAKAIHSKTVKLTFKKPYAAWKLLFSSQFGILPKHALQGKDFNEVWNTNVNSQTTGKPIGSGPFILESYTKGQSMTMVRNPKFYGKQPKIDKIVFRFITNTDSEIQAIKGGEVDAIYPQPQLQLGDLRKTSGLKVLSSAGATYEHIDFNAGKKGFALARAPWFRQAFAYSIDRTALTKQLFGTLKPDLQPLQSLTYQNTQKQYQPHFAQYTYKPAKAAAIMTAKHGCTKGGDGIFVCNGVRASVKYGDDRGQQAPRALAGDRSGAGQEVRDRGRDRELALTDLLPAGRERGLPACAVRVGRLGRSVRHHRHLQLWWRVQLDGLLLEEGHRPSEGAYQELDPAARGSSSTRRGRSWGRTSPRSRCTRSRRSSSPRRSSRACRQPDLGGPPWNVENWSVSG